MNGVVMIAHTAQLYPSAYRHVSYFSAVQCSSSCRTSLLSPSCLVSSSISSSSGAFEVSELGRSKPFKKNFKHVAVRALAETDPHGTFRRSQKETKEVIMVDPLEAKRLAAEEWKLVQARAALQRQQQIEAINGGWAVLGLTAAIVIEGYTGKGILKQIAGYLDSIADFIAGLTPGP